MPISLIFVLSNQFIYLIQDQDGWWQFPLMSGEDDPLVRWMQARYPPSMPHCMTPQRCWDHPPVFLPFDEESSWPLDAQYVMLELGEGASPPSSSSSSSSLELPAPDHLPNTWLSIHQVAQRFQSPTATDRMHPLSMEILYHLGLLPRRSFLFELIPSTFLAGLPSATLPPFTRTNSVLLLNQLQSALPIEQPPASISYFSWGIVDPGFHSSLITDLKPIFINSFDNSLPSPSSSPSPSTSLSAPLPILIVLTHHHHDHVEGIPALLDAFPDSSFVLGLHPDALPLISADILSRVSVRPLEHRSTLSFGPSNTWEVLHTPGHTASHLMLWHGSSGVLLAGDHVVGRGSSVLDASSGGNMMDYLRTTRELIELKPSLIIPAHGNPSFSPLPLLRQYIDHRLSREEQILQCCLQYQTNDPAQIVSKVYASVPQALWPSAIQNIKLHLEKLIFEGRL